MQTFVSFLYILASIGLDYGWEYVGDCPNKATDDALHGILNHQSSNENSLYCKRWIDGFLQKQIAKVCEMHILFKEKLEYYPFLISEPTVYGIKQIILNINIQK